MVLSIRPNLKSSDLKELERELVLANERLRTRKRLGVAGVTIVWIILTVVYFQSVEKEIIGGWVALTIVYFFASAGIANFLRARSYLFAERARLTNAIDLETARINAEEDRLLAEAEEQATRNIAAIKSEINSRRLVMISIEEAIKYKRKWRSEFDTFPYVLAENSLLDRKAGESIRKIANELEAQRERRFGWFYKYKNLRRLDSWTNQYANYQWLKWRLERMKSWEAPERGPLSDEDVYDESEEANDKARFAEEHDNNADEDIPPQASSAAVPSNELHGRASGTNSNDEVQTSLFDGLSLTEKPLDEVPHQEPRLPSYQTIKVSQAMRDEVNQKKVQIGLLGELAVVELETIRLAKEKTTKLRQVVHTSLVNDAAGYDIQSWDGDSEIYIEVKTTVGDFWSNLFFTQREYKTMNALRESYCLYRICNFDVDTQVGKLFIYKGAKMINETFEFQSKLYVLGEKRG